MITTVLCVLLGIALGNRFKVLCLVPVILAGTAILVVFDHLSMTPLSSSAWAMLALAIELQGGYLLGAITRSDDVGMLPPNATELAPLRGWPARIS